MTIGEDATFSQRGLMTLARTWKLNRPVCEGVPLRTMQLPTPGGERDALTPSGSSRPSGGLTHGA